MLIDQADYALLNAVSIDEWFAYLLNAPAGMENIMNVPGHGLGEKDLIEHFFRLWNYGLLECSLAEAGVVAAPDADLVRRQFEHTSSGDPIGPTILYRLTRAGGNLWERYAVPS